MAVIPRRAELTSRVILSAEGAKGSLSRQGRSRGSGVVNDVTASQQLPGRGFHECSRIARILQNDGRANGTVVAPSQKAHPLFWCCSLLSVQFVQSVSKFVDAGSGWEFSVAGAVTQYSGASAQSASRAVALTQ